MSYRKATALTPDDNADLPAVTGGLLLSASGTVRVQLSGDSAPVDLPLMAGIIYPLNVARLYVTGTDADIEFWGFG